MAHPRSTPALRLTARLAYRSPVMTRSALALAIGLVVAGQAAAVSPRTWSGAAGGISPFWDLASNWLEGPPLAGDMATLGAFDTAIRSGAWELLSVTGSAKLTIGGGSLALMGPSSIGTFALGGGMSGGPGPFTVGTLAWTGGGLGNFLAMGGTTIVTGTATLTANGHAVDWGHRLELKDNSTLAGNGQLYIGGAGVFNSVPYGASSVALAAGKTLTLQGQGLTSMNIYGGGMFENAGTVSKTGAGATLFMDSSFNNAAGTLNALAGEVQFRNTRTLSGMMNVSSGATLHLNGGTTLAPGLVLSNAGSVVFDGVFNVLASGSLTIGGNTTLAAGALGGAGAMTLANLAWNGGSMGVAESLGGATLVNGSSAFSNSSHSIVFGHMLRLNGDASWGANGQLFIDGAGNYNGTLYAASVVELTAGKTLSLQGDATAFQIYGNGTFQNAGTLAKTAGTGTLFVDNRFANSGTLRADVGLVQLRGTFDNTGTLHANGARIEITQPSALAQWDGATQTLTGGTYRVTGAQPIAMNLGFVPATGAPALIRTNQGSVMLEGAGASIDVTTTSPAVSALSGLAANSGVLSLTAGANLAISGTLANQAGGKLVVGAGSELRAAGAYTQSGSASSTLVGGHLVATLLSFEAGSFSAGGAAGAIGTALLDTVQLSFSGTSVLAEDFTAGSWDQITLATGSASLGGTLSTRFGAAPTVGTYRFLTAQAGAVSGTFSSVLSNLDPAAYSVSALYGSNFVDLRVTAVPEPKTVALMLGGLLLLGLRSLRRQAKVASA